MKYPQPPKSIEVVATANRISEKMTARCGETPDWTVLTQTAFSGVPLVIPACLVESFLANGVVPLQTVLAKFGPERSRRCGIVITDSSDQCGIATTLEMAAKVARACISGGITALTLRAGLVDINRGERANHYHIATHSTSLDYFYEDFYRPFFIPGHRATVYVSEKIPAEAFVKLVLDCPDMTFRRASNGRIAGIPYGSMIASSRFEDHLLEVEADIHVDHETWAVIIAKVADDASVAEVHCDSAFDQPFYGTMYFPANPIIQLVGRAIENLEIEPSARIVFHLTPQPAAPTAAEVAQFERDFARTIAAIKRFPCASELFLNFTGAPEWAYGEFRQRMTAVDDFHNMDITMTAYNDPKSKLRILAKNNMYDPTTDDHLASTAATMFAALTTRFEGEDMDFDGFALREAQSRAIPESGSTAWGDVPARRPREFRTGPPIP